MSLELLLRALESRDSNLFRELCNRKINGFKIRCNNNSYVIEGHGMFLYIDNNKIEEEVEVQDEEEMFYSSKRIIMNSDLKIKMEEKENKIVVHIEAPITNKYSKYIKKFISKILSDYLFPNPDRFYEW